MNYQGFPCGSVVKNLPAMQEMQVQSLGQEDPLENEMTTYSSILAMDRGVWQVMVYMVTKNQTRLKCLSTAQHTHRAHFLVREEYL